MTWALVAVIVIGTFAAWLAFFVFKRKERAEIIIRLVLIETHVAELRKKGGDIQ